MRDFISEFFISIYCWFEDFFGENLGNYLQGDPEEKFLSDPNNMFISIGLTMLCITMVFAILYYYIINHPRLGNWWGWLIFLSANAVINFIVGWQWVLKDYFDDKMLEINKITGEKVCLISEDNILAFGVTNMIDAIIAFIVISFIIKWWSSNCQQAPL